MAITFQDGSGIGTGTTSINIAYPSSTSTNPGQLLVLFIAIRVGSNPPIPPRGWMLMAEGRGTFGTAGAGVGPTRTYVFVRSTLSTTSDTGSITVYTSGANVVVGSMSRWSSDSGEFYVDAVGTQDSTQNTQFSMSFTPDAPLGPGWIRPGDAIAVYASWPSQSITTSSLSISSPGLSFTGQASFSDPNSTTGNDIRGRAIRYQVESGTQTDATVTFAANFSSSLYGAGVLLRITDSPLPNPTPGIPFVVGRARSFDNGTQSNIYPPIGARAGDLLVATGTVGRNDATDASEATVNGWTVLDDVGVNTRRFFTIAKIYNPADSNSSYELSHGSGSAGAAIAVVAIREHGIISPSDIQVGIGTSRPGGSPTTSTALSLTTPKDNMLVLAAFGEATNAVGDPSQTTGDFIFSVIQRDLGVSSAAIEYTLLMEKAMTSAGVTGNVVLDYSPAGAANGRGIQLAIPSAEEEFIIPHYVGDAAIFDIYRGGSDLSTIYVGTV